MNARGALGRYGEDLAARRLAATRADGPGAQLAVRQARRDRHRRRRRRRPGGLRGQDPQSGARSSTRWPPSPPQGRPAAVASPSAGLAEHGGAPPGGVRIDLVGVILPDRGAARGRACAGGGVMGFARTCSVALVGVEGVVVEVQADLEPGVAAFTLVGLPDKSLTESRDRVRAAIVNSGETWPQKKLTVGLSPASVPKGGSGFDLAVACAVLAADERIAPQSIADLMMIGELGLDGRVRPVRGVLPAVLAAADAGYRQVVVPERTAAEASLVPGVSVLGRPQPAPARSPSSTTSRCPRRTRTPDRARAARTRCWPAWPCPGAGWARAAVSARDADRPDLADVVRAARGAARPGGRRGRRTPPLPQGSAGRRARPCSPSGCRASCRR